MVLPGLSSEEMRGLILSIGTHHKNRKLSPMEVSDNFAKAIKNGASLEECAEFVHLSGTSMVARFLKLQQLSPEIKHLIDWGQSGATISFTSACEFVRLNEDEQEFIATTILEKQLKKEEVRQIVQIRKRAKRSLSDCIDEVIRMRPETEVRYVYMGSITSEVIEETLGNIPQEVRNKIFESIIETLYPCMILRAGRLGTKTFTLVTDAVGSKNFSGTGRDEFEKNINNLLASRVNDYV